LLAEEYHFDYQEVSNQKDLGKSLETFFDNSNKPKLLEINTKNCNNSQILRDYFNFINE
jgi:2-succinyl-5-enolpyruvyl-6-hydroxy-3-cyclohexene-1-carboxylate synthase